VGVQLIRLMTSCRPLRSDLDRDLEWVVLLGSYGATRALMRDNALARNIADETTAVTHCIHTSPAPCEVLDEELWMGEEPREAGSCRLQGERPR
jgi:hypothetical protein